MKEPVFPHKDEILRTILNFVKPKAVILFGSRVRGIFSKHSDIDLFLRLDKNKSSHIYNKQQAEEIFERIRSVYVNAFESGLRTLEERL